MLVAQMNDRGPHRNWDIHKLVFSVDCIRAEVLCVDQKESELKRKVHTTVMLSTLNMKGSEVRYRESERAYSFQSCANKFCDDAIAA